MSGSKTSRSAPTARGRCDGSRWPPTPTTSPGCSLATASPIPQPRVLVLRPAASSPSRSHARSDHGRRPERPERLTTAPLSATPQHNYTQSPPPDPPTAGSPRPQPPSPAELRPGDPQVRPFRPIGAPRRTSSRSPHAGFRVSLVLHGSRAFTSPRLQNVPYLHSTGYLHRASEVGSFSDFLNSWNDMLH